MAELFADILPAGRVQRRLRRPRHRRCGRQPPDPRDGVDHRQHRGGQGGRARRGRHAQALPPRAGREGPGDRVRRRRPRAGGGGHRGRRLLQRRARTARRRPACSPASAYAATSPTRSSSRRRTVRLSKDEQPDSEDFFIPPLNNPNQLGHVGGLVERAPDHAKVLTGGERATDDGYFYAPTVIDDVQQGDEMARTEIFGPVITVQPFSDEDEALRVGQQHGLRAGLERLDQQPQARDAHVARVGLRLRLGQLPHPAGRRDAARRLQAVRATARTCRQYSLDEYTRVKHVMSSIEG